MEMNDEAALNVSNTNVGPASDFLPALGENPTASQLEEGLGVAIIKLFEILELNTILILKRIDSKEHPDPKKTFRKMFEDNGRLIGKYIYDISNMITFQKFPLTNEFEEKIPITYFLKFNLPIAKELYNFLFYLYETVIMLDSIIIVKEFINLVKTDTIRNLTEKWLDEKFIFVRRTFSDRLSITFHNIPQIHFYYEKNLNNTTTELTQTDFFKTPFFKKMNSQFQSLLTGMGTMLTGQAELKAQVESESEKVRELISDKIEPKKEDGPEQWGPPLKISDITKKMGWPSDRVTTLKIQVLEKRLRVVFKKWGSFFYEKPTLKTLHEYNDHPALKNPEKTLYRDPDRKKKHSEK